MIATGLEAQDEQAMLIEALDRDPAPKCYVCEGPGITRLGDRLLAHYDMTGQCREQHPHVAWDIASPRIDEIGPAVENLAQVIALREDLAYAGHGGLYVNPESYLVPGEVISAPKNWQDLRREQRFESVIEAALLTAGSSGHGTRDAMDWLAAGRLAQMAAYCRRLPAPARFNDVEQLLAGSEADLRAAVNRAWQCLAPVEEAIRHGVHAQPLDLRAWLTSSSILGVSLPHEASMAHRQVVIAMLMAAEAMSHQDARCRFGCSCAGNELPAPTVIWHHAGAPHPKGDGGLIAGRRSRWLVLPEGGAGFAGWVAHLAAGDAWQPICVLGSVADARAWEALAWRLFVSAPALSAGQVLFVPDGGPPLVLDRWRL